MCAGPLCTRSFRTYAVQASLSIYQYFLSYSTYKMSSIIKWLTPRMHCHNSHTNTEFNTFEYPTKKSGPFIFILFGHLSSISESSFLHFLFPFSLQCLSKVQTSFLPNVQRNNITNVLFIYWKPLYQLLSSNRNFQHK